MDNFLWGVSTSAHQVEGGNKNDWTEWEKKNAGRMALHAEFKFGNLPSWPRIKTQAKNPQNYISGLACDHYNRFAEDFNLARELGHNAHRFSIEWSRIEPTEGSFDEREIEHYRQVIKSLRERNIEPFVTLWHWPIPLWLRDKGGWSNKDIANYFSRYVEKLVEVLGEEIKYWITINEPMVYASMSYLFGDWPPQKKNLFSYLKVIRHLAAAHQTAYKIIKKKYPQASIGLAHNMNCFEPYKNKVVNQIIKKYAEWWWNFSFLNRVKNKLDFIGLNYYSRNVINFGLIKKPKVNLSDLGWGLYPKGVYAVLKSLARYQKPIYITENGLADMQDKNRSEFIEETLKYVFKAKKEGIDVRGYLYWSLLDNFEWDKGFWPRFGLVEIDYNTLVRKIRPSAYQYKKLIEDYQK